ncbi:tRNA-dependent cyclodipeptide synthase [Streptomyces lancefieldiae]|uniref:Cyclodipeptide synthase n=1 Tax=Streptomyces lancefieldiae TaxID=3075520 RepID=A0ABU3ANQ9_9ACTN|nr:tRNA-dependent cyclodipeptide synthase [Streptomyces sp. DSM 40712]MDT0611829.1 tRNA-dependent cyclodipeptide synthase [Streptomyces sp. DSM 40712]
MRTDHSFVVEPYSENCRAVYGRREHVVVGVSPGNSYFRVGLLADLLGWLRAEFKQIDVVIPDSALVHTYVALGYPAEKASKKAHAETSVLRNRVLRAWEMSGNPRDVDGVHRMSELSSHSCYQKLLASAEGILTGDPRLRETALGMSREVLLARRPGCDPTCHQLEHALRYITAELPFFLGSAEIFGVPSSLCFYHQRIPLANDLFAGRSGLRAPERQGYAVIRPRHHAENRQKGSTT